MLGDEQLNWFVQGITGSSAIWKLWGNQVFVGELSVGHPSRRHILINNDAWDGYAAERRAILQAIRDSGTRNLVTVTGDLHSFMASYMKIDHQRTSNFDRDNVVGIEFMTPSVTSAGIAEIGGVEDPPVYDWGHPVLNRILPRYFLENLVRATNRHIRFFNSQDYGVSTLTFTRSHCDWIAYTVDKRVGDRVPPAREIHRFRVPRDRSVLSLGTIGA
jgi:alkaline phosphatase D